MNLMMLIETVKKAGGVLVVIFVVGWMVSLVALDLMVAALRDWPFSGFDADTQTISQPQETAPKPACILLPDGHTQVCERDAL